MEYCLQYSSSFFSFLLTICHLPLPAAAPVLKILSSNKSVPFMWWQRNISLYIIARTTSIFSKTIFLEINYVFSLLESSRGLLYDYLSMIFHFFCLIEILCSHFSMKYNPSNEGFYDYLQTFLMTQPSINGPRMIIRIIFQVFIFQFKVEYIQTRLMRLTTLYTHLVLKLVKLQFITKYLKDIFVQIN